ncbi:MAG: homoserine kinase [Anaerolineaceae bacterium]
MKSFLVRVPATTANLGPGFDCLGLALDLWNEVVVSVEGQALSIEIEGVGSDSLPQDSSNAIFRALFSYAAKFNKSLPSGLRLSCKNRIPLGSGLGSSAAAVVAGILAASSILDIPNEISYQLDFAVKHEGHPDNVAPCLMGGLVVSGKKDSHFVAKSLPISALNMVIVHPFFVFPTKVAREVLPRQVSYSDSVFNIYHSVLTCEALRTDNLELLKFAMQDRIHQPYRLPLIPGAKNAIEAAKSVGAITVVLSGAGPSLLAISPNPETNLAISSAMQREFLQAGLTSEVFFPKISFKGASVIAYA